MFSPNSPVTVNDVALAIAKIRGVPDKDAMLYCKQAGIFEDATAARSWPGSIHPPPGTEPTDPEYKHCCSQYEIPDPGNVSGLSEAHPVPIRGRIST